MHNGMLATLDDVVEFYNQGGGEAQNKTTLLKPLKLTAQEKKDLVAFLEALSMDEPLLHDDPKLPGDYQPLPAPTSAANKEYRHDEQSNFRSCGWPRRSP